MYILLKLKKNPIEEKEKKKTKPYYIQSLTKTNEQFLEFADGFHYT
jgi:hypothetical protein